MRPYTPVARCAGQGADVGFLPTAFAGRPVRCASQDWLPLAEPVSEDGDENGKYVFQAGG